MDRFRALRGVLNMMIKKPVALPLILALVLLLSCALCGCGLEGNRGERAVTAQNTAPEGASQGPAGGAEDAGLQEPERAPAVSLAVPEGFELFEELESGTVYLSADSYLYLPAAADAETVTHVYYAGGVSGWLLSRSDLMLYLREFEPRAVMLWFHNSGIWGIPTRAYRTVEILTQAWNRASLQGERILITGSSYGGYTALAAAAILKENYGIETSKIAILDMGNDWGEIHDHFSDDQAETLLNMGTVVYHVGERAGVRKTWGAKEYLKYGIPTVELKARNVDHDRITSYAFRRGFFSWLTGERELDAEWYTETWRSFP